MASGDVLGYPPQQFRRMWLEHYWKAMFGATDIGVSDFPTLEDFLRNNADRTYEDAKRLLLSFASSDVLASVKSISAEEERLASAEGEYLEEELSKVGIGEMALDKIRRQKEENEKLKAEITELKKHPRKKAERKAKPLTALPSPAPEKPAADYVTKLCKQSPLSQMEKTKVVSAIEIHDIEQAIKIIKECKTLDEFDKFELEERLRQKAMGIITPTKEAVPKAPIKSEPKKQIISMREVTAARKEERVLPFKAVEYEYHDINLQNAKLFLRDYQQYLPGMLQAGLQKWLETHRTAFKFPLTTHNVDSLSAALQYSIVQPEQKSIRNTVAVQFVSKHAPDILIRGLEKAASNFAWSTVYSYYKDTLKTDMPPMDKFKQDVIGAAKSIQFSFD